MVLLWITRKRLESWSQRAQEVVFGLFPDNVEVWLVIAETEKEKQEQEKNNG